MNNADVIRCFSYNWCITWNNYPATALDTIKELFDSGQLRYVVAGKETSPTTGTPHLQMFVQFKARKRLVSVRKVFPGCWAEPMKTTALAAADYCKKDGDFIEHGTLQYNGTTLLDKWQKFLEQAQDGEFDDMDPGMYIRYHSTVKRIRTEVPEIADAPLAKAAGVWIWGPPGTGKTTTTINAFQGAYLKDTTKWWDQYSAQDVVILDELDKKSIEDNKRNMKVWGDRIPFNAESKGSTTKIRPLLFIVTCNWSVDELYSDPIDVAAMKKRYFEIKFDTYKKYTEEQLVDMIEKRTYPSLEQLPT